MQLDGRATVSKLEVWVRFPPSAPVVLVVEGVTPAVPEHGRPVGLAGRLIRPRADRAPAARGLDPIALQNEPTAGPARTRHWRLTAIEDGKPSRSMRHRRLA